MKAILLVYSLIYLSTVRASYMYSIGTYVPGAFTAQETRDGGKENFALNPSISIGTQFHAFGDHFFTPEIGYVYNRSTYDDVEERTIFLLYTFNYRFTNATLFRYGLGTFWHRYSGDGGAIVLNNGTGSATFYKPDKTVTTYTTDLMLGIEQFFRSDASLRFDLAFTGWKSEYLDNKNYILTVNFYVQ